MRNRSSDQAGEKTFGASKFERDFRGEPRSDVEEHRLVVALQMDVEPIDCVAIAVRALGDQRRAAIDRHQRQHGSVALAASPPK